MNPAQYLESMRGREVPVDTRAMAHRRKVVDSLNEAQAGMEAARERIAKVDREHAKLLQHIKSEKGTAEAEFAKHAEAYEAARALLGKLTPPLGASR